MNAQMQFYIANILVLLFVDMIAVWSLDLQVGQAGVFNFAWIMFQSAGAYTAAVLTLGPDSSNGGFQHYIGGAHVPYPLSVIAAGAVAALLAVPIGLVTLSRLRGDYQAIVMLVLALIATGIATAQINLVNGPAGLALIPAPGSTVFKSQTTYQWFYVGIAAAWCAGAWWVMRCVTGSPLGRRLRAVRDSETAAAALGKSVAGSRMLAFVVGGALAGVSGAVYVQNLGAWSPGSWYYTETFLFLTAIIVGGSGNLLGAALGALVVPILFQELTRYIPNFGYPGMIDSLQWVAIGLLLLAFLWWRPRGLIPARRRKFSTEPTSMLRLPRTRRRGGDVVST